MTKWMSNDRHIHECERAKSVIDLDLDELPVERTLGVKWNVENDEFGLKVVEETFSQVRYLICCKFSVRSSRIHGTIYPVGKINSAGIMKE